MKDCSKDNITVWKKVVLALVIINFLALIGLAIFGLVSGITTVYVPPEEHGFFNINPKPLLYFAAVLFALCAIIELPLGIATYRSNKGAAIALLVLGLILLGYVCAIAAIIALVKIRQTTEDDQEST